MIPSTNVTCKSVSAILSIQMEHIIFYSFQVQGISGPKMLKLLIDTTICKQKYLEIIKRFP